MARRSKEDAFRKLLDAWKPPDGSGDPVGCLATTFTFDPLFFEGECLAGFVGLESDADDDKLQFLIEQEERLSQLKAAVVLVDQHHCRGRRSLRWDLLPARVPARMLHAKVALLVWTNCARVIIGSANLTEDGYRRNLEVFGTLDFYRGSENPVPVLHDTVTFLDNLVRASVIAFESSAAVGRWRSLLEYVRRTTDNWGVSAQRSSIHVHTIFSGLGATDVLGEATKHWPASAGPAWQAWVVSPFFDPPDAEDRAAHALWKVLRRRGPAEVHYCVEGEDVEGKVYVLAPKALQETTPRGRDRVFSAFHRIPQDQGRRLHAKAIWFEGDRYALYVVGSSNFTAAGLGLSEKSNIEANLVYVADLNEKETAALETAFPSYETIPDDLVVFKPRANEDETDEAEYALLPPVCEHAAYRVTASGPQIVLQFAGTPPPTLSVLTEDCKPFWDAGAGPGSTVVLSWKLERPPSGLWVQLYGTGQKAWWPVEVESGASLAPPEELRDLPLEVLVRVLTSAQPLSRVLAAELARRNGLLLGAEGPNQQVDPHSKVDTSKFLMQRSRRVGLALRALCERLAQPAASEAVLHWRIAGPVGLDALVHALVKEARSNEEKAFLLTDLALSLARVRPVPASGCLPVETVQAAIAERLSAIRQEVGELRIEAIPNLTAFIEKAFQEIGA